MYVERLDLKNFGAIAESSTSFVHPGEPGAQFLDLANINVILGTNGSGKSSVLKAIAGAVRGDMPLTLDDHEDWIRLGSEGPAGALVELRGPSGTGYQNAVYLSDEPPFHELHLAEDETSKPPGLLLGYGADRLGVAQPAVDTSPTMARLASLFGRPTTLASTRDLVEVMAPTSAADVLSSLLPADVSVRADSGRLSIAQRGLDVPVGSLSDGIRSFLAWVVDLLFHLHGSNEVPDQALSAAVLVDEVDQRMHPSWQTDVLTRVSREFPTVQFIMTAQSPLLVSELRPENLHVLEEDLDADGRGAMRVRRIREDVFGMSVDQVLHSSYFELTSTRGSIIRDELAELSGLAADDPNAALSAMRLLASPTSRTPPAPLVDRRRRNQLRPR